MFLDSHARLQPSSDKVWESTFNPLTRTASECNHGVVLEAIEDTVAWLDGDDRASVTPSSRFTMTKKKSGRQFLLCFVFLGHTLGCPDAESTMESTMGNLKRVLETARRKVIFVPLWCEHANPALRLEALLLARLSGGFVVSPHCEIDFFPLHLVKAVCGTMKWCTAHSGRDENEALELVRGESLASRASIFDDADPPTSVSGKIKALLANVSRRHACVPLPN